MIVVDSYSFNNGSTFINEKYPHLLREIEEVINRIDASTCLLKKPKDKEIRRARSAGVEYFYSPPHINALFDYFMFQKSWLIKPRIKTNDPSREGYREIDFLKEKFGVEGQMGKYAFLTYDIVAKMVIFRNLGMIECAVEICPTARMLPYMSSGIGAFEQVKWDLEMRGADKDFDVPVLILGIEDEALFQRRVPVQTAPDSDYKPPTLILNRYSTLPDATLKKVRETGLNPET